MDRENKLFRIGDRLDKRSQESLKPYFRIYENLSIRIFDPSLPKAKVSEFYVNSAIGLGNPEISGLKEVFLGLGDYERFLAGKISNAPRKIILLIGSMGSGKTTTLTYLRERFIQYGCLACKSSQLCKSKGRIVILNLNEDKFLTNDEVKAKQTLLEELCISIRGFINLAGIPDELEELTKFWNLNINKLKSDFSGSAAFIWISSRSRDFQDLNEGDYDFDKRIAFRKQLIKEMESDKTRYLDYLIRLWGYTIETHFSGNNACSFMIFDNIDKASSIVQSELVSILDDCSSDPGPTMVVSLRPETMERFGLGRYKASKVWDVVLHEGIKPSSVVLDRFTRFVQNPEKYFDTNDGMSYEEFLQIKEYLFKIYAIINPDDKKISEYLTFLDKACGSSSRLALLCAENLLKVSSDEIRDPKFSIHSLIRTTVINQAYSQFRGNVRSPIPNLFDVKNSPHQGIYLIKPRILLILRNLSHPCSQNNIRMILKAFDYPEMSLIKDALEEMQSIYCQLIRSNGFEKYETEREFLLAGNQRFQITDIGLGYIDHIFYSLDYVQEAMLDCRMPEEWISQESGFSHLQEKFRLVLNFLRRILDIDSEETLMYCSKQSRMDFFKYFKSKDISGSMISVEMIYKTYLSLSRIIDSINKEPISSPNKDLYTYTELLNDYKNLVLLGANKNLDILGVYPKVIDNDSSLKV